MQANWIELVLVTHKIRGSLILHNAKPIQFAEHDFSHRRATKSEGQWLVVRASQLFSAQLTLTWNILWHKNTKLHQLACIQQYNKSEWEKNRNLLCNNKNFVLFLFDYLYSVLFFFLVILFCLSNYNITKHQIIFLYLNILWQFVFYWLFIIRYYWLTVHYTHIYEGKLSLLLVLFSI